MVLDVLFGSHWALWFLMSLWATIQLFGSWHLFQQLFSSMVPDVFFSSHESLWFLMALSGAIQLFGSWCHFIQGNLLFLSSVVWPARLQVLTAETNQVTITGIRNQDTDYEKCPLTGTQCYQVLGTQPMTVSWKIKTLPFLFLNVSECTINK